MDSTGSISKYVQRLSPFLALLRFDLRALASSWLVRLWLGGSVLLTLMILAVGWKPLPSAQLIAVLLSPYLVFPWFLVVLVLGVDPVSSARVEALADGILSRPVTRYEYLLASWAARLVVVLGAYLVVIVPAVIWVTCAERGAATDHVTLYGIVAAITVVGLVLTFQVSLGYLAATVLRRPLLAIVVLLFVWYPSDLILHTFSLEEFSTISLSQAMPKVLRTPWRAPDKAAAEKDLQLQDLANWAGSFSSVFGAGSEPPVQGKQGFFESGHYEDFSLFRVILGYGLPTLLALGWTMLSFCYRDL